MRIALLHNPKAGNGTFRVSKFVRQIEKAGHKVVYASIKQNDWQNVFAQPIEMENSYCWRSQISGGSVHVLTWRLTPNLAMVI